MFYCNRFLSGSVALVCLFMLSACSTVTPVQEIVADQSGYLAKNFVPQALSPALLKKLPEIRTSGNFGTLRLTIAAEVETSDGKKEAFKSVMTLVDKGNGLVQRMTELSNNDIPYVLLYSLTFRNMIDLRWQNVPLRSRVSSPVFEIKSIERIEDVSVNPGSEFAFEFTSGSEIQIANYLGNRKSCKTTGNMAASELHPKLLGRALSLECELRENNALQYRTKMVFLQNYGLAVLTEMIRSSRKTRFSVVDVGA